MQPAAWQVLGRLKRQEALYKAARAKEEALAAVARRKEAEARGMAYNLELHAQRVCITSDFDCLLLLRLLQLSRHVGKIRVTWQSVFNDMS